MTASSLVGFSYPTTPRLAMIEAHPSTMAAPSPTTAQASSDAAPTPTTTQTATGSGQPGAAGNGSPPGQWQYAEDSGSMIGTAGAVWTFRVAVESGLPVSVSEFTAAVDGALGDYRSWAGAGTVQMLRVPGSSASNFTVVLAQPWTAYSLCLNIGIDIRVNGVPFTNCQAGAVIVINGDRYLGGVGGYSASLSVYRQYAINHEVGHRLGHGHLSCPGPGQLAPVMQQQTIGLQGCLANAWPYPNAAAPPAPDPVPTPPPTTPAATTPPPTPTPTASPTTSPPVPPNPDA
jgi:cell division septation protein DedD